MNQAWKTRNLRGAGLQGVNLMLARQLKRRWRAYAWWLLFPVGAHRLYLGDTRSAWLYPIAAVIAALAYLLVGISAAAVFVIGMVLFAIRDLWWIDRRLNVVNKQIRMSVLMQPGGGPAPGFQGRYTDASPDLTRGTTIPGAPASAAGGPETRKPPDA